MFQHSQAFSFDFHPIADPSTHRFVSNTSYLLRLWMEPWKAPTSFCNPSIPYQVSFSLPIYTTLKPPLGLPWIYALPLSALLIRLTLLPIGLITRRNLIKQISLTPILLAWKQPLQKITFRDYGHLGPKKAHTALLKAFKTKRVELYERHGCQLRKNYLALIQIPIFLSVMETLRKMSGAREGLLGMMVSSEPVAAAQDDVEAILTSDGLIVQPFSLPLEPSFATEGALWFPNLLLPDPTLALPTILSLTLLLSLYGHKQALLPKSRWILVVRRSLTLMTLAIPFVLTNIPSSLLLYWISNAFIGWCQNLWLDWYIPIKGSMKPLVPKRKWRSGLGIEEIGTKKERDEIKI
jgi:inner membrane protein COX18